MMVHFSYRQARSRRPFRTRARLRAIAILAVISLCILICPPAFAVSAAGMAGLPAVKMFGYAAGPKEHVGSAAGLAHYVPASATRAGKPSGRVAGHDAPAPDLASLPVGTGVQAVTGSAAMPAGQLVAGSQASPPASPPASPSASASPSGSPSPSPSASASGSPSASASASPSPSPSGVSASTTSLVRAAAGSSKDNASYSVAATFDTVPMADLSGRIAVTLTNTGTTTWSTSYALGSQLFPSGDTKGTGTALAAGANVALSGSVAPNGTATVESVTPPEDPGSYELCWDMVNASGTYFSAEGGSEYCAAYTVAQYSPVISEQEPLPGTDVDSQDPELSASAVVPGGYPASPSFSYAFQILNGPNPSTATVVTSSGWVANHADNWTPTTALSWGNTYYWQVTVSDAASPPALGSGTTWTTPISFVVGNAQPGVSAQLGNAYQADDGNPVMTSDLGGGGYTNSGKTVDPRTGNIAQQVTDASVATVSPSLSIVRTYNSLDPRTSQAFGAGWSSILDMSMVLDSDGSGALVLTMADGQQVRFAKNAAGGYAPPQDMYAVVTALSGGGFSVTDQSGTTYSFAQASGSSWLISGITDESGRTETFTYSSGELTTITNTASGRALHITWATPSGAAYPHVATVSTDAVTAGQAGTALTWTYGYSGDLLTSVCSPASSTACTTYGYVSDGSHAPTSVLNADPTSYFRLDDAAGATAAANEIPVNDLAAINPPATEMNTTPGVAGPISGVTATGFNGTSSWIPLDGLWCTTAGVASSCSSNIGDTGRVVGGTAASMAISVWFKTSTASGPLVGLSAGALPGQACNLFLCAQDKVGPLLWISNGDLDGYGTSSKPMASTTAVDNGAWHQAVLIPGQALYLDGKEVATDADSYLPPQGMSALLGAAPVAPTGAEGSNSYTWSYFDGSMADLSIYQDQLPSSGTVAAQYAAETTPAAELNSITSPGGRTELSATYDTVNDRVAALSDADGGTWKYGDPVQAASSGAYDSAVMGNLPEDFWPLSDAAGPLARDLVGGAVTAAGPRPPATYSSVTLGATGPSGFPDGTAAAFNGTSSQISIPGGYFAGTGAESAELWFSTTKGGATLLSSGPGTGGEPLTLWVSSGGCLEGQVGSTAAVGSGCAKVVNDGNWHQAVLTVASGSSSLTVTLYQDGAQVATEQIAVPAASATGYVAHIGSGPDGFLAGSVADVSLYTSALTSDQVTGDYNALQAQSAVPATEAALNTQTYAVTDPVGANTVYMYDTSGSLLQETDVLGGVTYYGYDDADQASTVTDPDGNTTYETFDAHNNITSSTSCVSVGDCQTAYTSYYEDLSNPLDPRNDKPTDSRDPRSASASDPTYDTVTSYTADGQVATSITPPTTACASGCTTTYAYTAGTEPAIGGGTEPAGLLASVTSPNGGVTSYAYDSAGDVMKVTSPLGLVTDYTYDNLGRETSQTQISNSYPDGLTTSYTYDGLDRPLTVTDPPVTDRVTGAVHTEVTTYTYDPDSSVLTTILSDATGGDPSRTTTDTYNSNGELATETDALGNETSYSYDAFGDKTGVTNAAGVTISSAYDAAGDLLTTTLDGYTGNPSDPITAENLVEDSRAYDPAGRLASDTNVMGTTTDYIYYGNGKLASSYVACSSGANCVSGEEDETTYSYDAAGNQLSSAQPGGLVTDNTFNADNQITAQTVDPSGVDRTATASYDPDGSLLSESLTGGGVTQTETMTYNLADQPLSQTVDNTAGQDLTTTYVRDQRGLVTSETDPEGNTSTIVNDEAGRQVVVTGPAVSSQTGNGAAPVTANPVTMTGYDTYGDEVESSDADGNVTRSAFNQGGEETSVTDPSYTPPGASSPINGTTTMAYDSLGQETSETDPMGSTTTMTHDQLGDEATETDPGGGVTTFTYDPAGEQTSVTDPTGAQTQATYNNLGEMVTTTDLVRQNDSAAYTTTYGYNNAGDEISQTSPTGVEATAAYNAVGEETSSSDAAGNTTTYSYNLDGAPASMTLPDGSSTTTAYDLAGWPVSQSDLSTTGTVLRTETAAYDPDGQATSSTDFDGTTMTYNYDPTGTLTSEVQPTSATSNITVSYGYDLDGNQTAVTDGNGNTTYTTYNSRSLPETITEPTTAQNPTAADSTTTDSYDADGDLVTQDLPGGVQISNTYDDMGDLTGQAGTGASAPTAARSFSYDEAGRMLTAATSAVGTEGTFGYQPTTSESFSYDDRGLLLAAAGSAGSSSFSYNGSGQLTSDTNASGTSTYTYNGAGLLATDADAASGTTGTYGYNDLDQITDISYGSGHDTQSITYDDLHRLASDTVTTAGGATVAAIGYGYNDDDDVTSMTTTGLDTTSGTGTVTNTYGYDEANRLTSWTSTPSGGTATTATYAYDNDGNMTNDNGVTLTYDARDEEVSDSSGDSYAYSADGDLTGEVTGSGDYAYTSDAYGQQITDGPSAFTWDAVDRLLNSTDAGNSAYSDTLTYDGMTDEVSSDSADTYSRDPSGQITGVDAGGTQVIALDDGHNDLSGTFAAAGTSMTSSTSYNPWGQVLATAGPAIQVGYQGQWTDPVTEQVNMGARMYSAGSSGTGPRFISQDTDPAKGGVAVTGGYDYADDNPMTLTDLTGHSPSGSGKGGSVSAGEVTAAGARAAAAEAKAKVEEAKALAVRAAAATLAGLAHDAAALARKINAAADKAAEAASLAAKLAAAAFALAQTMLHTAESWQDKANAEWAAAWQYAKDALTWEVWKIPGYLADAAAATVRAVADEEAAALAMEAYLILESNGMVLRGASDAAHQLAVGLAATARGDEAVEKKLDEAADAAEREAEALAALASADEAAAKHDVATFEQLGKEYASQALHKAKKLVDGVGRAIKKAVKAVAHAAAKVGKVIATHAKGLEQAALVVGAVALTVVNVLQLGLDPVTDAAEGVDIAGIAAVGADSAVDAAGEAGADAAGEAGGDTAEETEAEEAETSCGGESFTSGTKVLLASGVAVPISQLRVGEKVLATNTRTGKTQAETVAAVLVHHDSDLYDLKIRAGTQTSVIDTTSSHLFFVPGTGGDGGRWVKAGALKYGTHLRTPGGSDTAVVAGGWAPRQRDSWMWDLTVPGNNDHDFYIDTTAAAILVHNCNNPDSMSQSGQDPDRNGLTKAGRAFQKHFFRGGFNPPTVGGFAGETQATGVMNPLGQDTLDDILTNPQTATQSYGDTVDMKLPWGGARFVNGNFTGFLTP